MEYDMIEWLEYAVFMVKGQSQAPVKHLRYVTVNGELIRVNIEGKVCHTFQRISITRKKSSLIQCKSKFEVAHLN